MKAYSYPWICIIGLVVAPGAVSADDYLDALKEEASELEYLDESRPGNVGHVKKQTDDKEILTATQNIANFEKYYKAKDAASAIIYLRLNTADRIRIFRRFKSTKNLNIVKKMTFDLYRNQSETE